MTAEAPSVTLLDIGGMHCQHCVMSVTRALQGVAGVDSVAVALEGASARVVGHAALPALLAAVAAAGFEAHASA